MTYKHVSQHSLTPCTLLYEKIKNKKKISCIKVLGLVPAQDLFRLKRDEKKKKLIFAFCNNYHYIQAN